jgi:hypothetical protein
MDENTFNQQEEKEIRNKAKKRVGFKIHSMVYFLICLLFWLFWFFIFKGSSDDALRLSALKVCLFITLTWGICVAAHYLLVYKWNKTFLEKEIKRLKKEKEKEFNQISDNN